MSLTYKRVQACDVSTGKVWAGAPALDELGRHLYETMEHMDPGFSESIPWERLPEHDRVMYVLCIRSLLEKRALFQLLADNNMISWQCQSKADSLMPFRLAAEGFVLRLITADEARRLLADLPQTQWDLIPESQVEWTPTDPSKGLWFEVVS